MTLSRFVDVHICALLSSRAFFRDPAKCENISFANLFALIRAALNVCTHGALTDCATFVFFLFLFCSRSFSLSVFIGLSLLAALCAPLLLVQSVPLDSAFVCDLEQRVSCFSAKRTLATNQIERLHSLLTLQFPSFLSA